MRTDEDSVPAGAAAWDQIPAPATRRIALRVTPEAERALRQGHPWLFEKAIRQQSHAGRAGDLAVVFDRKGHFLAVGLYDPHSVIRVRILQHGTPAAIGVSWWSDRLAEAARRRLPLQQASPQGLTTGYRLAHGENDRLPGLVIDRYEDTLVAKLYTVAWIPHLRHLWASLQSVAPAERLVLRLGRSLLAQPEDLYGLSDGQVLSGPPLDGPVLFWENGLRFEADPLHGQKTGFFLDQRDNRARVERLAAGKTVLDLFAYTGGFAVYAGRGGARSVLSVDTSGPALEAARRNWQRNDNWPGIAAARHEVLAEDVFEVLARLGKAGRSFGLVIVDPPAFAQEQAQVTPALAAYERLTRLSLAVLAPGGILVQASCSTRVAPEVFFATVLRAAARAGRPLREIERTGHTLDHPVAFPEGAYLKCLFAIAP